MNQFGQSKTVINRRIQLMIQIAYKRMKKKESEYFVDISNSFVERIQSSTFYNRYQCKNYYYNLKKEYTQYDRFDKNHRMSICTLIE